MANYCKKSSLEALADEIRVRNGDSSSTKYLFPSGFTSTISGLLIPTQRGAPSKELKTNDSSYTIQKGVYTGGSVFVDPIEWPSVIQSSSSQQTIKDTTNNKPLKKVTVAAANSHPVATGAWRGSTKNPTSITISGFSFAPIGICLVTQNTLSSYSTPYWFVRYFMALSDGTFGGYCRSQSMGHNNPGSKITSASVSFNNNSVSISNLVCNDPSKGNQTGYFYQQGTTASGNAYYFYYIWG